VTLFDDVLWRQCRQWPLLTLSAVHHNPVGLKVRSHYPFHPLYGLEFELLKNSSNEAGTALISAPDSFCRQIPTWMLDEQAASLHLTIDPSVEIRALFSAAVLLEAALNIEL